MLPTDIYPSLNPGPSLIGIEGGDAGRNLFRIGAEVFLENNSVLVHQEGHDSAVSVLRRDRDKRETAAHFSLVHVVARTTPGIITLRGQDTKIVAVKRNRLVPG